MTDRVIEHLKSGLAEAALSCAAMETIQGDLKPEIVNSWSRKINQLAGWLIVIYGSSILVMGFAASSAYKIKSDQFLSLMIPSEISDFRNRFETGRIGHIPSESYYKNSKKLKQK